MTRCSNHERLMTAALVAISAVLIVDPYSAVADDAVDFGIFWGLALAVEDACEQYAVRTDAAMGGHLSAAEYEYATSIVDRERANGLRLVEKLGCDQAAEEAVKLTGKSFSWVWEVR